mmetsp:Transcript_2662/g.7318  ORF Transcript_2662/g.7318 Transcript_2662/m.7318 type:complete len:205 (-) Transcript_2662:659-1273(-)
MQAFDRLLHLRAALLELDGELALLGHQLRALRVPIHRALHVRLRAAERHVGEQPRGGRVLSRDGLDGEVAVELPGLLEALTDAVALRHQVSRDPARHDRVVLVVRVRADVVAHPRRRCEQLACGARDDEVEVRGDGAQRDRVGADDVEVGHDHRAQPAVRALAGQDLQYLDLLRCHLASTEEVGDLVARHLLAWAAAAWRHEGL